MLEFLHPLGRKTLIQLRITGQSMKLTKREKLNEPRTIQRNMKNLTNLEQFNET
jgi:hypothetical protein